MQNTDAAIATGRVTRSVLGRHLAFAVASLALLMVLFSSLRLALLIYNRAQLGDASGLDLLEAFGNGLRFDLQLAVFGNLPLLFALLSSRALQARRLLRLWLTAFASFTLLLGIVELDFYREFNQRLNGLVFQYLKEDPKTVLSMLWFGFPVLRYLLAWAAGTWLLALAFRRLDRLTELPQIRAHDRPGGDWIKRSVVFALCIVTALVAMRGTLRQGPPLRWGDAFTTDSMFANQLGLNATTSLLAAARARFSRQRDNIWKSSLPPDEALATVREMLLTGRDHLVDAGQSAVRRDFMPVESGVLPIRNVVVILMESFSGQYVGALGGKGDITPHFDALAREGLLFTRFFSNGTHTHQGMFATLACFPNLPGFEYLMQQPEGNNGFSGLPQLLGPRKFDNLYVYNGDFAWDNQSGFFGKQGVTNFIGRFDFRNPVVFDPTWGVADQDMFDRAAEELARKPADRPFYALLQTLSNHTPYPLPPKLPVEPVTGHGPLDAHLTAMRYSDWALGQFFEKVRKEAYFKDTLFVVVGDHGFAGGTQLTELNLQRFNVPLLLIAPGIQERFGKQIDIVGTQVDVVPTVIGRLGGKVRHQCWGRDLLSLAAGDPGMGVIKPSGNDQTVGIVTAGKVLVLSKNKEPKLYGYELGSTPKAWAIDGDPAGSGLQKRLQAYLQVATQSLLANTTAAQSAQSAAKP